MKTKKTDWAKVKVDTPIMVGCSVRGISRYFAFFKDGEVYAWAAGCTSWTAMSKDDVVLWPNARLPTKAELAEWKAGRG